MSGEGASGSESFDNYYTEVRILNEILAIGDFIKSFTTQL